MQTFVDRRIRPRTPGSSASEVQLTPGQGIEILSGGGAGVVLSFLSGDDQEQRTAAIVGDVLPVKFDRFQVFWPDIGAVNSHREINVRIWRRAVLGRVNAQPSPSSLGSTGRLLTIKADTIAADTHGLIYDSIAELPARENRIDVPGQSGSFLTDEVFLQIVMGTVTAGEIASGSAPSLELYAYTSLLDQDPVRVLAVSASLSAVPATAEIQNWSHFFNAANTAATARILAPPNGFRLSVFCPAANSDGILYSAAVYARGRL